MGDFRQAQKNAPAANRGVFRKWTWKVCLRNESGFRLADFALTFEGGTLFHLQAYRIDGAGDHRSRRETAGVEIAVPNDFPLDYGLLGLEVPVHRGILTDGQAAF